jgi:predicted PurR-regulated permease PerM
MKKLLIPAMFLTPMLAHAQTLTNILQQVKTLLDIVIPIVITLAVIYFLWGLAKFLTSAGDSEKHEEGRNIMIWGVIAIFVIVSFWGLVRVIQNTFSIQDNRSIDLPGVPDKTR